MRRQLAGNSPSTISETIAFTTCSTKVRWAWTWGMRTPEGCSANLYHCSAKKAIALYSNSEYEYGIRIQSRDNAAIREDAMLSVSRRSLLTSAVAAVAAGTALSAPAVLAQAAPIKLKLGNDLPDTHSVNVRLKQAVEAINADTKGQVAI